MPSSIGDLVMMAGNGSENQFYLNRTTNSTVLIRFMKIRRVEGLGFLKRSRVQGLGQVLQRSVEFSSLQR